MTLPPIEDAVADILAIYKRSLATCGVSDRDLVDSVGELMVQPNASALGCIFIAGFSVGYGMHLTGIDNNPEVKAIIDRVSVHLNANPTAA